MEEEGSEVKRREDPVGNIIWQQREICRDLDFYKDKDKVEMHRLRRYYIFGLCRKKKTAARQSLRRLVNEGNAISCHFVANVTLCIFLSIFDALSFKIYIYRYNIHGLKNTNI